MTQLAEGLVVKLAMVGKRKARRYRTKNFIQFRREKISKSCSVAKFGTFNVCCSISYKFSCDMRLGAVRYEKLVMAPCVIVIESDEPLMQMCTGCLILCPFQFDAALPAISSPVDGQLKL